MNDRLLPVVAAAETAKSDKDIAAKSENLVDATVKKIAAEQQDSVEQKASLEHGECCSMPGVV